MGYALFTARKLSLTTRLNMCNANLACNSERTNALSNSIFAYQSKSALDYSNASTKAYSDYEKALNDADSKQANFLTNSESLTDDQKDVIDTLRRNAETALRKALNEADSKQSMTNIQIQKLNLKQNLLDQERQRLQTQLNAYNNEMSNVEKAEESAIKNSAPKFS